MESMRNVLSSNSTLRNLLDLRSLGKIGFEILSCSRASV